jgi:charged multivesicular body protein 4
MRPNRDKLREQNAFSEEIGEAMSAPGIGQGVDEVDLEAELEELQQEQLDEQMLKTGTVPVADAVHKMPSPANAERESAPFIRDEYMGRTWADKHATAVSAKKAPAQEEDDDAELEKLRAEMAM